MFKQCLRFVGILVFASLTSVIHAEEAQLENDGLMRWGYIESAKVLGRIAKFEERGYIINGWEFVFNYGDHGDGVINKNEPTDPNIIINNQNKYLGIIHYYSTLEPHIRDAGEDHQNDFVILHYNRSLIRNFLTRDTVYNVVDISPLEKDQDPVQFGIPEKFLETKGLPWISYKNAKVTGKIIKVMRWGRFYTGCAMVVQKPGVKIVTKRIKVESNIVDIGVGGGVAVGEGVGLAYGIIPVVGEGAGAGAGAGASAKHRWEWKDVKVAVLNAETYKLASEEACRHAEALLPFDRTVNVSYRQSWTGITDYSKVVKAIELK